MICLPASRPANPAAGDSGGRSRRAVAVAAIGVWLAAAAAGLVWLNLGPRAAGQAARPPAVWPADSRVVLDSGRPTLLLFVHPHCPCSRASIAEFAALLAARPGRANPVVVFYSPAGVPDGWGWSDLWERAAAIPGATVLPDSGEAERRRFAVVTSGQLVAYTPDGRLAYAGGVTRGRGHAGPNPGRAVVEALLDGRPAGRAAAPVYGCPLTADAPPEDQ